MKNKGQIERGLDIVYPFIVFLCVLSITGALMPLVGFGLYSAALEFKSELVLTDLLLVCFVFVSIIAFYIGFNTKTYITYISELENEK